MSEVVWRDPVPADQEILLELQRLQNVRLEKRGLESRVYDVTRPEKHPQLVYARVAERDGIVVGVFFGLINIELETVLQDAHVYESLPAELEKMAQHFDAQGIETGRGFVPTGRARFLEKILSLFPRIRRQKKLVHFYCDFRGCAPTGGQGQ